MPPFKAPSKLSELCLLNLIDHHESYWLAKYAEQMNSQIIEPSKKPLYVIGPFESYLNDEHVEFILRCVHARQRHQQKENKQQQQQQQHPHKHYRLLNKNLFYFLFHNRLRRLDLNIFSNIKIFTSADLCAHIGNNCYNLVELNLFGQKDLTASNLCEVLRAMSRLKVLDLSHTRANMVVCAILATKCALLEQLSLENCQFIDDACVDMVVNARWKSLLKLNVDNLLLSVECVQNILLKCVNLRHLCVENFLKIILQLYNKSMDHSLSNKTETTADFSGGGGNLNHFKLESIVIDSRSTKAVLKEDLMEALVICCTNLRKLTINCIGTNGSLRYLNNFVHLNELLLANTASLHAFSFDGSFLDALKSPFGKQLKNLHLIYVKHVNLRSICKHCPNLVSLYVEFACNYDPAKDKTVLDQTEFLSLDKLKRLSLSNYSFKSSSSDAANANGNGADELLKGHFECLMNNGRVKRLCLRNINEFDTDYFMSLFSKPLTLRLDSNEENQESSSRILFQLGDAYLHQNIEDLELKQMNRIEIKLIFQKFFNRQISTSVRSINLEECKQITRADSLKLKCYIQQHNMDCKLNWS